MENFQVTLDYCLITFQMRALPRRKFREVVTILEQIEQSGARQAIEDLIDQALSIVVISTDFVPANEGETYQQDGLTMQQNMQLIRKGLAGNQVTEGERKNSG